MSFYGTVYYQISNAFASFFIKNTGLNNKEFLTEVSNSLEIPADGRDGQLTFDAGNRWIQMEGDTVNNYCKIYHAAPDESDLITQKSFLLVSEESELSELLGKDITDINLSNDTYLKTKILEYDKAGHISKTGLEYFKIPRINIFSNFIIGNSGQDTSSFLDSLNTTEINSNGVSDTFKIDSGNKWIQIQGDEDKKVCKIYHNKSTGMKEEVQPFEKIEDKDIKNEIEKNDNFIELDLSENVYLKANVVKYDEAGHFYNIESQYFKIPLVKTSEILSDHEKRIEEFKKQVSYDIATFESSVNREVNEFKEDVEENVSNLDTSVKTFGNTLTNINKTLKEHTDSIEDINKKNGDQDELISNLNKICGSSTDLTKSTDVTLCNAIGNIDYLRNKGNDEEGNRKLALTDEKYYTVCDFIWALKDDIATLHATSSYVLDLMRRVDALENPQKN